jgi:hypothetical protein
MKQLHALLATTLLLASCETVVDVPVPAHKPRLALTYTFSNEVPTPDYQKYFTLRGMFISASQGVLETKTLKGRNDATVELFDASGQVVEHFRHKARIGNYYYTPNGIVVTDSIPGYYVPTRSFAGTPGQTYTLRASAPGLEPVEALLTLPNMPVIASGNYVPRAINSQQTYYSGEPGRLTLSIADNAATTDYYLVSGRVLDKDGKYWGRVQVDYNSPNNTNTSDVTVDRLQLSNADALYNQYPYSDANGNGKLLSLGVDVVLNYDNYLAGQTTMPKPAFVEIIVSSLTPDAYRFHQSLQRYFDTDGNPFAEPAPLFSNLRPGYGIFGGSTDARLRIPL